MITEWVLIVAFININSNPVITPGFKSASACETVKARVVAMQVDQILEFERGSKFGLSLEKTKENRVQYTRIYENKVQCIGIDNTPMKNASVP